MYPWPNLSEAMQNLINVARRVDNHFALLPASESMINKLPPLTTSDPDFLCTPIELGPYTVTNHNQMTLVKPGATHADGRPKKQPIIYATIRFLSTYATQSIL